jgi:hypothetical protein
VGPVAVSDMAEAVEAAGVPPEAPPELAEDPGGVAGDGAPAAAGGEANVSEAELDRIEAEENGVFRVSSAELEKSVAGGRRPHHDLDIITESEAVGSGEEGGDGAERDFGHMGAEKAGTDERGRTVSKRRGSLADRLNPNNLLHAAASPEAGGARGKGNKKPSRKMIAPAEPTTVERQGMAKRSPLAAARFGELDLLSTHAVPPSPPALGGGSNSVLEAYRFASASGSLSTPTGQKLTQSQGGINFGDSVPELYLRHPLRREGGRLLPNLPHATS